MLKRIKPEQVRLGMFIEAVDGEWSGKPFWRSRFLLTCAQKLEALRTGDVTGITINTSIGTALPSTSNGKRVTTRVSKKIQLARALQTMEQSKPLIKEMFDDARMGSGIRVNAAMEAVTQITACMADSSKALIAISRLKSRDEYTFLHSIAVAALMVHLAKSLKIDAPIIQALGVGGLLHDVGKTRVPLEVLNKAGPLSDAEMVLVRKHPLNGHEQLARQGEMPEIVLDICLHHHERLDGRGYPKGLCGDEISVPVRIASICDVYDALTSRRAYKKAWVPNDAAKFMYAQEGQFDRTLLRQFFHCMSL